MSTGPEIRIHWISFRTHEFAGSTHDTKIILWTGTRMMKILNGWGGEMRFEGADGEPNDYPYEVLFQAAFNNLYQWVRNGVPAPHGERYRETADAKK